MEKQRTVYSIFDVKKFSCPRFRMSGDTCGLVLEVMPINFWIILWSTKYNSSVFQRFKI